MINCDERGELRTLAAHEVALVVVCVEKVEKLTSGDVPEVLVRQPERAERH